MTQYHTARQASTIAGSPGSPDLFQQAKIGRPLCFPLTDTGNAELLVRLCGPNIHFCSSMGWLVFDGSRWTRDTKGNVQQYAKRALRRLREFAKTIGDKELREAVAAHALRSESLKAREAMIALAQAERGIPITADELDVDPYLLNVANGTINLQTGELREHRREDLNTKIVPVSYDPRAEAPRWEAFLNRIFAGNQPLISFIQRAVGYSLTADTSEQCLFICFGPGANGKSVFCSTLGAILGDYGQQAQTATFLIRKNRGVPNDIAALCGARLVLAVEAEQGEKLAEALVKQLTGGDKVRARFLFHEEFEFKPALKLWLAVNHKPAINGGDHPVRRRIRLIPFSVTISEEERDPHLAEKLKGELPGILAWAVRGTAAWASEGMDEPQEIRAANAAYCAEMDELADFLADCCEVGSGFSVRASEIYKRYADWRYECGEVSVKSQTAFGLHLVEGGFEKKNTNQGRLYLGIKLREKADSAGA